MIYLGKEAVGVAIAIVPANAITDIQFDAFKSYNESYQFFQEYVAPLMEENSSADIDVEFINNTNKTRAGQWAQACWANNQFTNYRVMRVGLNTPQGGAYGVDIYAGATVRISIYSRFVPQRG